MKHFQFLIQAFIIILITACSGGENIADFIPDEEEKKDTIMPVDTTAVISTDTVVKYTIYASVKDFGDNSKTRSALIYDRKTYVMKFNWGTDQDKANIGVIYGTDGKVSNFTKTTEYMDDTSSAFCKFETTDQNFSLTEGTEYIAFRPYEKNASDNFESVSGYKKAIDYTGQDNGGKNVEMGTYYKATDATDATKKQGYYDAYDKSETEASAHLGKYDYLVTTPQTQGSDGSIYFPLGRIGVVARFFIKCPAEVTFTELHLVTLGNTQFVLKGSLDLKTRTTTATETNRDIVLKYGSGLNMADKTGTAAGYYDTYNGETTGYIVSYMMLYPVDLRNNSKVFLYLKGHGSENIYKYYKSTELYRPLLYSNEFYQWPSAQNDPDKPISMSEVTFEEFEEYTNYSNGNNNSSSGTDKW